MPTSTRSTRRSSSATTRAARAAGDRRRGVVLAASYEAKAWGVRTAMGGSRRPAGCVQPPPSSSRGCPPTPRRARPCSRSSRTTPLVEGLSIDEAFLDVGGLHGSPGRRRDRRPPAPRRSSTRSACRSPSASPGPSSWPRWPGRGQPDGLLLVPPEGSSSSSTRCRSSGCGASAPVTAAKLQTRGSSVGQVAQIPEIALVAMLGRASGPAPARAGPQPRPAGCPRHAAAASMARSARSAVRHDRRRAGHDPRRARRPLGPRLRRGSTVAAPWCCGCASAISPAQPGRTRSPMPRRGRRRSSPQPGLLKARPLDERQGLTLLGVALANLQDDRPIQLALPFDRPAQRNSMPHRPRTATGSIRRDHRAVLLGHDRARSVPLLPD